MNAKKYAKKIDAFGSVENEKKRRKENRTKKLRHSTLNRTFLSFLFARFSSLFLFYVFSALNLVKQQKNSHQQTMHVKWNEK